MKTEFFINNQSVHTEGREATILQACEKFGLFIPRFCYSESLSIAGNCRMCLVEVEGSPKLAPACAVKVANGMKIHTKTNLVRRTRESILEFLLINHPLDCPICDQGGECDLQDQAMIYGSDRGRFYEYKRSLEDKNGGPLIKTIMTRCIHCTRCIRFATEIAGIEAYGTSGRGKNMEVGTYVSKLFESELSGNVIDLCPVGALTSKPYAFTVRPWELKSTESIDVLDGIGSNIRIDTRGSELMRILPATRADAGRQWITDKTRFSYDGLKCQRLNHPMWKTKEGTVISISWKQAFSLVRDKTYKWAQRAPRGPQGRWKHFGVLDMPKYLAYPQSMKGIIGPLVDQETILAVKVFFNQLGISNLCVENVRENLVNVDFRFNYLLNTGLISDDRGVPIDFVLLLSSNPRFEGSLFNVQLRKTILSNSYRSKITIASIGIPMNLTYPFAHWGTGTKSMVEFATGKHNGIISYIITQNPIIILGMSLLQRNDNLALWPSQVLSFRKDIQNVLSRRQNRRHSIAKRDRFGPHPGNMFPLNILHAFACTAGAFDLAFGSGKSAQFSTRPQWLYLIGADCVDGREATFIIYQGHHGQRGAQQANLILPATSYVEKKVTYVNTEGRVQQTQIAAPSGADARDDWQIVKALSTSLDLRERSTTTIYNAFFTHEVLREEWFWRPNPCFHPYCGLWPHLAFTENFDPLLQQHFSGVLTSTTSFDYEQGSVFQNVSQSGLSGKNTKTICPSSKQRGPSGHNVYFVYNSNFIPLFDNFYLSDVVAQSSVTMGKCSTLFKNHMRNLCLV